MTVLCILCLFNRNQVSYSVLLPPKFYSTILCLTKGIQILKACLVAQSCLPLWDPMNFCPPGSFVHGDSPGQEYWLEWVAMPSSRGSSQPRGRTQVSCTAGGFFTVWATGKLWYRLDSIVVFIFKHLYISGSMGSNLCCLSHPYSFVQIYNTYKIFSELLFPNHTKTSLLKRVQDLCEISPTHAPT